MKADGSCHAEHSVLQIAARSSYEYPTGSDLRVITDIFKNTCQGEVERLLSKGKDNKDGNFYHVDARTHVHNFCNLISHLVYGRCGHSSPAPTADQTMKVQRKRHLNTIPI